MNELNASNVTTEQLKKDKQDLGSQVIELKK